jgi:hypothetical protein
MAVKFMSTDHPKKNPGAEQLLLLTGVVVTLAFGLPGLYLVTRFRRTVIDGREVLFRKGSCFGSSVQRRGLSEFLGLHQFMDVYSTLGAGDIAMTVLTAGMAQGVTMEDAHILLLKHRDDKSLDVMLACNSDGAHVGRLLVRLAERFSLDILDPGVNGFTIRGSDRSVTVGGSATVSAARSDSMIAEASEAFSISNLPPGMTVADGESGTTTILLPHIPVPGVVMIMLGSLLGFVAAGMVFAGVRDGEGVGFFLLALALFAVAVVLIGLDIRANLKGGNIAPSHRRRKQIKLDGDGITYRLFPHAEVTHVPWSSLRNVVIAGSGKTSAVALATNSGSHQMAIGSDMEVLTCLRQIILDKAAEHQRDELQ